MPAFNAAKTLKQTYSEVPLEIVDEVILVDDGSTDPTVRLSKELGHSCEPQKSFTNKAPPANKYVRRAVTSASLRRM